MTQDFYQTGLNGRCLDKINGTSFTVSTIQRLLLLLLFFRAGVQPTLDPYAEAFL